MRLTFNWKWVVISLLAFAPVRFLARETDLPNVLIWAAAIGTLFVIWIINLMVTGPDPNACGHEWAQAPRGWECYKCGKTTSNPPSYAAAAQLKRQEEIRKGERR